MTDNKGKTDNFVDSVKKGSVSGQSMKEAGDATDNRMLHGDGVAKDILDEEE